MMTGPVATCAGSSGGAQPPPDPHRLPAFCESAPAARNRGKGKRKLKGQKKGRGKAKGVDVAKYVAVEGKIRLSFEKAQKTWKAIGPHASWYDSAVGIHTRECCEPFHDTWRQVPAEQKAAIQQRMLSWFNIDMSGIIRGVVNRDAQRAYRDWKSDLVDYFRGFDSMEAAIANPPDSIRAPEHWQRCCERFVSHDFQEMSKRNKRNRARGTIPSHHGRKSYVQYRTDKADPMTHELYPAIENWKDMRMPGGQWTNDQAEEKYNMMAERLQTQMTESGLASTIVDENVILEEVLGKRRGRKNGIGPTLPQSWLHYLETQAAAGTSNEPNSTADSRIRRLEDIVARLVGVIQQFAPNQLPRLGDNPPSSSGAPHNHDEDTGDLED